MNSIRNIYGIKPCDDFKARIFKGNSYLKFPKEFFGEYIVCYDGEPEIYSGVNKNEFSSGFYQYYPKGTLLYDNFRKGQKVVVKHGWYKSIHIFDKKSGHKILEGNLLRNKYNELEFQIWCERGVVTALRAEGNTIQNMVEGYEFRPAQLVYTLKKRIKIGNFYLEKID